MASVEWALNSAVECHLHTVEVIGSNPIAPTIFPLRFLVTRSLTTLGISPAGSRPQNGSSSYSAHQLPQGFVFRIREFSFAPSRRCELDVSAEGCPKCCVHRGFRGVNLTGQWFTDELQMLRDGIGCGFCNKSCSTHYRTVLNVCRKFPKRARATD